MKGFEGEGDREDNVDLSRWAIAALEYPFILMISQLEEILHGERLPYPTGSDRGLLHNLNLNLDNQL